MGDQQKRRRSEKEMSSDQTVYHVSVLLKEAVDALQVRPDGMYVDCTFGGGGHSKEILQRLGPNGKLLAFDQDPDAKQNLPNDERIIFIPHNFRYLLRFMRLHQVEKVDGILADLGVSSHQFDEATRGFSTRFEGPLDMRMDPATPITAAIVLQTYTRDQLQQLFSAYGEISNSRTLADCIVAKRRLQPMQSIAQLKTAIHDVVRGNPHKYLAQVFQSLRIEVNQEMEALKELLQQLPEALKKGGRAVIISFHSLEDRMVKQFFRDGFPEATPDNPFSTEKKNKSFSLITKKPIQPNENECIQNPRSRSARLRVAEKN